MRGFQPYLPRRFGLKSPFALLAVVAVLLSWRADRAVRSAREGQARQALLQQQSQGLLGYYPQREPHRFTARAQPCAVPRDGSKLIAADFHGLQVFDMFSGLCTAEIRTPNAALDIALAPDGRTMLYTVAGADAPAFLADVVTGKSLGELPSPFPPGPAIRLQFVGNGYIHSAPGLGFVSAAFAANGQTCATGCDDGTIILWDVVTYRERSRLSTAAGRIERLVFAPDGSKLAASDAGGRVILLDVASGAALSEWSDEANAKAARELAFSPEGRELWFAFARGLQCVPCDVPERSRQYVLGAGRPVTFAFCRDGRTLLTAHRQRLLLRDRDSLDPVKGWLHWFFGYGESTSLLPDAVDARLDFKPGERPVGLYASQFREVFYLSALDAVMVVQKECDEGTNQEDHTTLQIVPLSQFQPLSQR